MSSGEKTSFESPVSDSRSAFMTEKIRSGPFPHNLHLYTRQVMFQQAKYLTAIKLEETEILCQIRYISLDRMTCRKRSWSESYTDMTSGCAS